MILNFIKLLTQNLMSGYRSTVLSTYLDDLIENRECYSGSDCYDPIHEFCDGTTAGMKHQDVLDIIVGFRSV
jgi:hypothetical protein